MTDRPDLRLPTVEAVDDFPTEMLPGVIAHLAALQARAAARMIAPPRTEPAPTEQGALTQKEAAARYRLPLRTLRFLTRTKRVPSYQAGRNRMVRATDLDHYLGRCRDQGVKVGTILDG